MKFEEILTTALLLVVSEAAPVGYGYQKGLYRICSFPGPLSDKFAGAIGNVPLVGGAGPIGAVPVIGGIGPIAGGIRGGGPIIGGVGPIIGGAGPVVGGVGPIIGGAGPVVGGFGTGFGTPGPFLETAPALVKRGYKKVYKYRF
jgi:hypothetical protein